MEHEADAIRRFGGECLRSSSLIGTYDLALEARFPSHESCYAFVLAVTATGHQVDVMLMIDESERDGARQLVEKLLAQDESPPSA